MSTKVIKSNISRNSKRYGSVIIVSKCWMTNTTLANKLTIATTPKQYKTSNWKQWNQRKCNHLLRLLIRTLSDMTKPSLLLMCGNVVTEYEGSKITGQTNKVNPLATAAETLHFTSWIDYKWQNNEMIGIKWTSRLYGQHCYCQAITFDELQWAGAKTCCRFCRTLSGLLGRVTTRGHAVRWTRPVYDWWIYIWAAGTLYPGECIVSLWRIIIT